MLLHPQSAVPAREAGGPNLNGFVGDASELASIKRALRQAELNIDWLTQQQVAVCRVPSPTFSERPRAEYLSGVFNGLGHSPTIDEISNVVVPVAYAPGLPYIAVTAHMDTILAPAGEDDIRVELDGTIKGPGVADNGPGLASLIGLAKLLAEPLVENPARNLLLVANIAEEGEGNLRGIRHIVEDSPYADQIDRYLVLDGASLDHITDSALGSKRFELVIEGRGGHSWNDFGTPHPVHALAGAIARMAQAELPSQPKTTLSVGVIEGGTSVNAIPATASAKIDVRSADPYGIRRAQQIVEDSARQAVAAENQHGRGTYLGCVLREIGHRPAAAALPSNPVADCLRAVDSQLGISSVMDCSSTDANIPLAAGIPAAAIGCGGRGGNAHAPGEWYDPAGRELGLRRLLLGLACLQLRP